MNLPVRGATAAPSTSAPCRTCTTLALKHFLLLVCRTKSKALFALDNIGDIGILEPLQNTKIIIIIMTKKYEKYRGG